MTAPLDRDGIRAIIPHREPFLLRGRGDRARAGRARRRPLPGQARRLVPGRPLPGQPDHAGRPAGRGAGPAGSGLRALAPGLRRQARPLRRHRRRPLQAHRPAGRRARPRVRDHAPARADREGRRAARTSAASWPAGRRSPSRSRRSRRRRDHRLPPRRRDARRRLVRPRAGRHQRRAGDCASTRATSGSPARTGIHERRIAADDESAADARLRGRPARARDGRPGRVRPRPDRRRDREPRLLLPGHGDADRRAPGRGGRGRVRPLGRLHRVRLRARAGLRAGRRPA